MEKLQNIAVLVAIHYICSMQKIKVVIVAALLFAVSATTWGRGPRYVFYFIGDGMGINQTAVTESYMRAMGMGDLNFRHFPVATFITTHSASSLVTDSAAAGSALATGVKFNNRSISMLPDSTIVETVAEKASKCGYGVGIITTDAYNMATPAAFSAHNVVRNSYDDIIEWQVTKPVADFAAGSTLTSKQGKRDEWIELAKANGIKVFSGDEKYTPVRGGRVMYLSNNLNASDLAYSLDRKEGDRTLMEYTGAALDYLYSNFRNGFFLMVECGAIDHSCHSRDAASAVGDIMDLAACVDRALEFYAKHPDETLIIVTSDHETGGLVISGDHPEVLANQKCTINALTAVLTELAERGSDVSWSTVKGVIGEMTGLWKTVPVSDREERVLTALYKETFLDCSSEDVKDLYHSNKKMAVEVIRYLDSKAGIMFTQGGHSGAPVGLYVKGARASEFGVCRDNTDVPKVIMKVAGYK